MSELRVLTEGFSHFFGFHDLCPWDAASARLLCLQTDLPERQLPAVDSRATVGVVDEATARFDAVGETTAWNWQQGARLQWIPQLGPDVIAFNVRLSDEDRFGARILDLSDGSAHDLSAPIYDVQPGGQHALSLDLAHLGQVYPGYGYVGGRSPAGESGLWLLPLDGTPPRLLVPLEAVSAATPGAGTFATEYLTHASFSPSGRRACVLHRRRYDSGAISTNLVVVEVPSGAWRIVARDKVSHFDWSSDRVLIAWCRKNEAIARLKSSRLLSAARFLFRLSRRLTGFAIRRRLYGESFREIDVETGESRPLGEGTLPEDGHPMINPAHPEIWVNDTYPDAQLEQTLMLYNQRTNTRLDLHRLGTQAQIANTVWRCDLHPRWDPTGAKICVDSAHLGRRQLCVCEVGDEVARARR